MSEQVTSAGPLARFLALPNDSNVKTIGVALMVCLVCSFTVSVTVVGLKDIQMRNRTPGIRENILEVAGLLQRGKNIDRLFEQVEVRVIDLKTGNYVDDIDPAAYDQRQAARDRNFSNPISKKHDIANIKRRARYSTVYLVRERGEIKKIVLPVHGQGFLSTMYGFIALESDANTICGIKFYEQNETPGMGGEIDNPAWRSLWRGKRVYDEEGNNVIEVITGDNDRRSAGQLHQVDGITGATRTSRGVNNILRFWMGDLGFKPYLEKHFRDRRMR